MVLDVARVEVMNCEVSRADLFVESLTKSESKKLI